MLSEQGTLSLQRNRGPSRMGQGHRQREPLGNFQERSLLPKSLQARSTKSSAELLSISESRRLAFQNQGTTHRSDKRLYNPCISCTRDQPRPCNVLPRREPSRSRYRWPCNARTDCKHRSPEFLRGPLCPRDRRNLHKDRRRYKILFDQGSKPS